MFDRYSRFAPYVSQAERKARAEKHRRDLAKKGVVLRPVVIEGRVIARSFWGRSWCENLESYADFANRLERGRTYARNGSVVDLVVERGRVRAQVMGSAMYRLELKVKPLPAKRWDELVERCVGEVASVVEVLQGRLPKTLLEALADRSSGLFPSPGELDLDCSCPDSAALCKHLAAVLYGIGARLDHEPETFFLLRGVEVTDLAAKGARGLSEAPAGPSGLAHDELASLFGIELEPAAAPVGAPAGSKKRAPAVALPVNRQAKAAPVRVGKQAPKAKAAPVRVGKQAPKAKAAPVRVGKPAPKAKAAALPKTLSWAQLTALGVSDRTVAAWVKRGVLAAPDARARYATTPATRAALDLARRGK